MTDGSIEPNHTMECCAGCRDLRCGIPLLRLLGLIGVLWLLLAGCGKEEGTEPQAPPDTMQDAQNLDAHVFPPTDLPFGKTYEAWSVEWWQWAFSLPVAENPLREATEETCVVAQRGAVWFLAGVTPLTQASTYHCAVPEGKALFLPIVAVVRDNLENAPPKTAAELRALARADIDGVSVLRVEIDGTRLQPLPLLRFTSPVFSFTLPAQHIRQASGATVVAADLVFPAVAAGFYVMLKPLPVGAHTLTIRGSSAAANLRLDFTYHLRITPLPPLRP